MREKRHKQKQENEIQGTKPKRKEKRPEERNKFSRWKRGSKEELGGSAFALLSYEGQHDFSLMRTHPKGTTMKTTSADQCFPQKKKENCGC